MSKPLYESSAPDLPDDELEENVNQRTADTTNEPTAPHIEAPALSKIPYLHSSIRLKVDLLYPSLEQAQETSTTNCIQISINSQIKPFTIAQLNALYSNPEIECSQSFERDFIHNELKANDNKHPLFELLAKYSRCRHALHMNRLDVESIRRSLEKDTPNLWNREKKTVKYQATCADGVVVQASESYE